MTKKATKGGNVILREVRVPNRVQPGSPFNVEVEVSNGAAYINPWDPDKCGLAPPGYKIEVIATGPDGQSHSKKDCITTTEVGTRDETYTFTFTAPSGTDSATVSANVRLRDSGKATGRASESVTIASDAPVDPDPDPGGGGNSNPFEDLPGLGGGGSGTAIAGAGLLLLLLAVAVVS